MCTFIQYKVLTWVYLVFIAVLQRAIAREMRKKFGDGGNNPNAEVAKVTGTPPTEQRQTATTKTGSSSAEAS